MRLRQKRGRERWAQAEREARRALMKAARRIDQFGHRRASASWRDRRRIEERRTVCMKATGRPSPAMPELINFPTPIIGPPDRGRLLSASEVARLIGGVSAAWVRRQVPHKLTLGHSTVRWYEADVRRWLERCRASA